MAWLSRPSCIKRSLLPALRVACMSSPRSISSPRTSFSTEDGLHGADTPQRPEQAHIKSHSSSRTHKKRKSIENELSEAMQSTLMPITTTSASRTTTSDRIDNPFLYGTASSLARPVNLALAPSRRRSSYSILQRQRSLSVGSLDLPPGDADPFAWLRQTVQEQRRQASRSEHVLPPSSSMPTSPMAAAHLASSPTSIHDTVTPATNDYFGAGLLSLVAGKGPVREHLHADVPPLASTSTASRFAFPSMPNLPSMPAFQAPSMPNFKAPAFPSFKAPQASAFMPDSLARMMSGNTGEGENQKYMDEEDQTNSDEPDWARIKVIV